ncbi:unnamed protein product [Fusarium fujikuroi]|nr:unnamed protein product [Fusarium fujikuroi]
MSPRSNEPPSPEAKERRARNRAAQLKFRKKKQEVDETRCNRIKHLEGVVERMSTVLVDFTDGLLQQEIVQQSPGMMASIQGVIADILTLANEAGDPEQDPKARKARGRATEAEYHSPKDSEHDLPSSNPSIKVTATPDDPTTTISPTPLTDDSPINMPWCRYRLFQRSTPKQTTHHLRYRHLSALFCGHPHCPPCPSIPSFVVSHIHASRLAALFSADRSMHHSRYQKRVACLARPFATAKGMK